MIFVCAVFPGVEKVGNHTQSRPQSLRFGVRKNHGVEPIRHTFCTALGLCRNGAPDHALLKRYPEPMAHGPEACEPSHPLWPLAWTPVSRHTRAEAVDTGCQRDIPVL